MRDEKVNPQNIYDDEIFFAGYEALRRNDTGLNGALEVPALRRLLPALSGLHVLDLGCGFGDFARFARERGAASVIAVDVSARMLDRAMALTCDSAVVYVRSSIEQYVPASSSLDIVVSSLALHYVDDYTEVVRRVYRALRPGGHFVLSVEHPMCTANPIGWVRDQDGHPTHWPVDCYQQESKGSSRWFVDGVIKFHRTVESYVLTLIRAGFLLGHLGEPSPTAEALAARPALLADCRRPPVLMLLAVRPAD